MRPPRRPSSAASSVTLGRSPRRISRTPVRSSSRVIARSEDVDMTDAETITAEDQGQRRFIVAVDYGTTMSSVSYAIVYDNQEHLSGKDVKLIRNYPNDPSTKLELFQGALPPPPSDEVPSEIWYPEKDAINANPFFFPDGEETSGDETLVENSSETSTDDDHETSTPKTYQRELPESACWGFGVQGSATRAHTFDSSTARNSRIKWAKLQLAEGRLKIGYAEKTRKSFNALKRDKVVRKELDFITDFLTCLFKHVKAELKETEGLREDEPVEMVLCVPVVWSCKANRDMHAAMEIAMENSGLGMTKPGCIESLFIISEPEAAAASVLEEDYEIQFGDTFVLIDAGGGTVDAVTYTVTNTHPLRLERQAVEPSGDLCGSSYLNEDFRAFAKERLKDETYLFRDRTLDDIVDDRLMKTFEFSVKRKMDFNVPAACNILFDVPYLQPSNAKRFRREMLPVNQNEFLNIFQPRMEQVAALMEEQITRCRKAKIDVHKVVLIGGYGDNKALQVYLESRLRRISRSLDPNFDIVLITPPQGARAATAVSTGAVLRAFNKDEGPVRRLHSSYGLLRREAKSNDFEGHKTVKGVWDYTEADLFVNDTLYWVFLKGETVPQRSTHIVPVYRTFGPTEVCIVTERFYVSDTLTESHWPRSSSKNKGKFEFAGTFMVDISDWREKGWMKHIVPEKGKRGKEHWLASFDIVMELTGRSMRCWARYPSDGGEPRRVLKEVTEGTQLPDAQVYMSIAAAFEPGTK